VTTNVVFIHPELTQLLILGIMASSHHPRIRILSKQSCIIIYAVLCREILVYTTYSIKN